MLKILIEPLAELQVLSLANLADLRLVVGPQQRLYGDLKRLARFSVPKQVEVVQVQAF